MPIPKDLPRTEWTDCPKCRGGTRLAIYPCGCKLLVSNIHAVDCPKRIGSKTLRKRTDTKCLAHQTQKTKAKLRQSLTAVY